jgi:hypothetical protein
MSARDSSGAPKPLNAVDSFEMFIWLQKPYADVAAANDFKALSSFEQWERLHSYVRKVGYLLGKKNVAAIDEIANESKAKLLLWLDEGYRRGEPSASPSSLPSHRLLHSKT